MTDKFISNTKDIIITFHVDGTITEWIFRLIQEKFSKQSFGIKTIFSYIYSSTFEEIDLNYKHKRKNIIEFINDKFKDIDKQKFYFYPQQNNSIDSEVYFDQFADFSNQYNSNFSFVKYEALKGSKGNEDQLQIALDYILKQFSVPTIILKEHFFSEEDLLTPDKINKKANCYLYLI